MAQRSPLSSSSDVTKSDQRLSLSDVAQVERIALKLGVSADRLREVVAQVGPRLEDVLARLAQRDSVD
jgi:hypothetical protein